MNTGLEKLIEAGESVSELKRELAVKEQELAVANDKAEKVLKEVAKKKEAAEKIQEQVQKVKDKAQSIVNDIDKDKKIAEDKLEIAKPALMVRLNKLYADLFNTKRSFMFFSVPTTKRYQAG